MPSGKNTGGCGVKQEMTGEKILKKPKPRLLFMLKCCLKTTSAFLVHGSNI